MKKNLCLLFFLFTCLWCKGQTADTIYYDSKWNKTDKAGKHFYRTIEPSEMPGHLLVRDFHPNGSMQMLGYYSSLNPEVRDGTFTWWYESGALEREAVFEKNNITKIKEWDQNGKLKLDKELVRTTSVENGKHIYKSLEAAPQFPGGNNSLNKYISKNLQYPSDAKEQGVEGQVIVRFKVNGEGKAVNPVIVKSVHSSIDRESIRLINKMPKWKPGRQEGKNVEVTFELPINFDLNITDKNEQ